MSTLRDKLKRVSGGLMIVFAAALALEATNVVQYLYSQKVLREEAKKRAETQLETNRIRIMGVVDQAEAAVRNSVWIARWCLDVPDSLHVVARRIVEDNPVVVGSTVALVPGYKGRGPFSPYAFRDGDKISFASLATEEYNYPSQEWFTKPIELGAGYWSEPYFDEGGGNILMTTYSLPITDASGTVAAVVTADISLEWLTEMITDAQVYPHSYGIVLSRAGQVMVSPIETLSMRASINDFADQAEDKDSFDSLSRSMLSGRCGNIPIKAGGKVSQVFFAPVARTGWSMSIVIPDEEIYRNLKRMGLMVSLLTILGLLLLLFILRAVAEKEKSYRELNEKKGMMEHELMIGRKIQQSMIPHIFPPFPERTDLDMSACLVPAKEVGGDLFDFYIRDEKLFFCIGDVSGKGVPASLVMAVTRSMFRTVSGHENNAAKIVRSINDSMSDMNDSNMFVTFFVGILDLKTGHLCYCNAGHNPPLILTDSIRELDVMPNVALGIIPGMEFVEQETDLLYDDALFLYTDGLNEAENAAHEQFGMKRMYEVLHTRRGAQAHLDAVVSAVKSFVGDAPQSDDLTMLFIHFLGGANGHILHLNNAISEISRLEGFMVHVASETGIDPGTASAINLALEEAVANVIDYAYPEGVEGPVELEFKNTPRRLTFILTDEGKEFDPTAAPEVDINADVEHRRIGGLGIHLVRSIMDSVSYLRKDGKNILTMIKNI